MSGSKLTVVGQTGSEVSVPKDFPPKIQELLKKKGWNWPPDERLKAQIREAGRRLIGI